MYAVISLVYATDNLVYALDGHKHVACKMVKATNDPGQTLSVHCPTPWDVLSHPMGQLVPSLGTIIKRQEKMERLVIRQKELHTLTNRLHTLIEILDYEKNNCLVYVVYADFKQIIIRNALADLMGNHSCVPSVASGKAERGSGSPAVAYLVSDKRHLIFKECHL